MSRSYDLLVIGSGPAGHHGAIQGAKLGKRIALVESGHNVGGVCMNTGTIPSKTLREAVLYLSGYRQRGLYGASYRVKDRITMEDLLYRCQHAVQKESDVYRLQFARNGVDLSHGVARFTGPNSIAVSGASDETELHAEKVLIATGTLPAVSADFPVDGEAIIDGDGVLELTKVPSTLIVVGGGVIGLEYACMFAALGTKITLVDGRTRLLEFADAEMVEALTYHLRDNGATIRLGEEVERVERAAGGGVQAFLKSNKILTSEMLLYTVGRQGNTERLNLSAAGLNADVRGRLKVNDNFQTDVAHIYAAGDVIGFPSLASTSMEQGRVAAANALGEESQSLPDIFPYGLYTIPEISFVGQTEEQLTADAIPYEVGTADYREIARGEIIGDSSGRLKLIFHRETEKLLGVHIYGEGSTELIHIGQAVMALGGTLRYFVDHVFNYPTLAECYKVAALAGINKLRTLSNAA